MYSLESYLDIGFSRLVTLGGRWHNLRRAGTHWVLFAEVFVLPARRGQCLRHGGCQCHTRLEVVRLVYQPRLEVVCSVLASLERLVHLVLASLER